MARALAAREGPSISTALSRRSPTMARRTADSKEPLASRDVIHAALGSLKANGALNLTARVLLMLFALCAAVLAVVLIYIRADKMVEVLTDQQRTEQLGEQLIALTAPVLVLM